MTPAQIELFMFLERRMNEDTPAWCVLAVDEDGAPLGVRGPFEQREQAFVAAAREEIDWRRTEDGVLRCAVLPLWGTDE